MNVRWGWGYSGVNIISLSSKKKMLLLSHYLPSCSFPLILIFCSSNRVCFFFLHLCISFHDKLITELASLMCIAVPWLTAQLSAAATAATTIDVSIDRGAPPGTRMYVFFFKLNIQEKVSFHYIKY